MVENLTLWDEVNNNLPDYKLSELANRSRCHRCHSMVWHLIDRAGFEVKLDPERLNFESATEIGKEGKTYFFPTIRMGASFVTGFLKSTANDITDADFDKTVYLAWHRCNPDNIRTEVIDHWKGKL